MTFRHSRWSFAALSVPLVAALALDASSAAACSCAEPLDPDAALAGADVVFEGTARGMVAMEADIGFLDYRGAKRFDFDVARYFKGQLGPDLSVFTVDQSSACGRDYTLDEPLIIYARYSDNGLLTDNACSNSHPSRFASDDGAALGSGVAPDPAIVSDDDELDGALEEAPEEAPEVSSGIHRVPLDAEPESRGCASSLVLRSSPVGRPWLAAGSGLALLAWCLRRRVR
jgi:hypothetical protein